MRERLHSAKTVALWALVGVALLLSFAGILSIGLFTMPIAIAGAILLLARPDRRRGWAILVGAAAPAPLLVAWFNRNGPGRICRTFPPDPAVFCGDQRNPWPWLAGAALSLAVAAGLFISASRRDRDIARSPELL